MAKRNKLVFIVTAPITAKAFLSGQMQYLRGAGFDLLVISAPGPELDELAQREQVRTIAVPMAREMSPWSDLLALTRLLRILWQEQPDIVNASTPKAGLLGMLAAWFAAVPVRVYQQRGLRLETTAGFLRAILTWTERIACACATQVVCNSRSLRRRCIELKLAPSHKLIVLGSGSSNGIRAERFLPGQAIMEEAAQLRASLGIAPDEKVVGFFGRLTPDKGFVDLLDGLDLLLRLHANTRLLVVGKTEQEDPLPAETIRAMHDNPAIIRAGHVSNPAPYFHLIDILALPSYREGFPNVPLEAALAQVPTVGYQATGTVDAVVHARTGWLVEVGAKRDLVGALSLLLASDELRQWLGDQAQQFALREFKAETVWQCWADFYAGALSKLRH